MRTRPARLLLASRWLARPTPAEKLPVHGVGIQPWGGGAAFGLGVDPLLASRGKDIDEVHLALDCPAVLIQPGHKGIDYSGLITAHAITLERPDGDTALEDITFHRQLGVLPAQPRQLRASA
jgi:hypothetical protein